MTGEFDVAIVGGGSAGAMLAGHAPLRDLRSRVAAMLPRVDLPDLILEVMAWHPGVAQAFTSVTSALTRLSDLHISIATLLSAARRRENILRWRLLYVGPAGAPPKARDGARRRGPPRLVYLLHGRKRPPRARQPTCSSSCHALRVYFHPPAVTLFVSRFTLIQPYPLQSDCLGRSSDLPQPRPLLVPVRRLSQALRALLSAVVRSVDVPVNVLWSHFDPATAVYGSFPAAGDVVAGVVVVGAAVGLVALTVALDDGSVTTGSVTAAGDVVAGVMVVGAAVGLVALTIALDDGSVTTGSATGGDAFEVGAEFAGPRLADTQSGPDASRR